MEATLEERYRLRQDQKVVGYARKIGGRTLFYSRDGFWWSGLKIEHNQIDESIGIYDIDRKMLHEWDIVEYRLEEDRDRLGAFLWSTKRKCFCIVDVKDPEIEVPLFVDDLQLFQPNDLRFKAYLFENPDLMEELGVRDEW